MALKLHGTEILQREIRVERHQTDAKKKKAEKKIKKEKMANQQKSGKVKKNVGKKGENHQLKNAEVGGDDAGGIHKKMGKKKKTVKEFMGTKSVDNKKVIR